MKLKQISPVTAVGVAITVAVAAAVMAAVTSMIVFFFHPLEAYQHSGTIVPGASQLQIREACLSCLSVLNPY